MPGMWGDHLGVVDLQLSNDSGKWQVTQAKAEARPIYDIANKKSLAAEDSKLVETLKAITMPHASSSASQSVNLPTICIAIWRWCRTIRPCK